MFLCLAMCFCAVGCSKNKTNNGTSATSATSPINSTSSTSSVSHNTTSVAESSSLSSVATTGGALANTTVLPVFARFDFGKKTRAEAGKMTSHEYIMSILSYDSNMLGIEFTDDSMIITALADGTFTSAGELATTADSNWFIRGTNTCYRQINAFAIMFEDMVTFDFEDELKSGYGSWHGFPFTYSGVGKSDSWRGYHQFMKIRLKNPTDNSIIAMQFNNGSAFASTQFAEMSVGAGKPEYQSYIYDLCYACTYPSGKGVMLSGQAPGNNWTWKQNTQVTGLRFHLLGAACSYAGAYLNNIFSDGESAKDYDVYYEYFKRLDTRASIKKGSFVEIDYIVFGSDPQTLDNYHSYIESSSLADA